MSEIQYGRMPELEKQLKAAQEAETQGFTLLQDKVTAEEIAEVVARWRSEEHTSELQSLMRISYAVFCLKKKNNNILTHPHQLYTSTTTNPQYIKNTQHIESI